MRTRIVPFVLLAASCTSLDQAPGVRRTHQDRWQAATAAYERDLARRSQEASTAREPDLAAAPVEPAEQ